MNADNRIMFRLSTPKKEAFLSKVKQDGKKASEVLIWLIDKYLEDLGESESVPEIETIKNQVERHDLEIQFLKRELLGEFIRLKDENKSLRQWQNRVLDTVQETNQ
jgi:hypothetical protein